MLASGFVDVFLVPCSRILKPDLDDSFAQARNVRNPFQVLTIWVAIKLEICLKNVNLLISESRPIPF